MKCRQVKTDGIQCAAKAMKEAGLCYMHNPNIPMREKQKVRARGGMAHKIAIRKAMPPIEIKEIKDVVELLKDTTNEVRSGEMDVKIANTLGFLAGHLIKALELSELERKIEEIERVVTGQRRAITS